jgi:EAL domain-containing protein (putative c-di-GMP-specific phosphodiesterase class I)
MVPPLSFIPTAESSGLILQLTQLCLEQATNALVRFDAARLAGEGDVRHDMFVSVNVSGRDFAEPDFVQNLMRIVNTVGVNPRRMKLEITESVLMENPDRAIEALRECRLKGLSIAIDDFGTGYSSLGYLHKFPIDTLKIDRSFVMAMHDDQRSMKIIQSVKRLAEQLKIPVVAEGIETKRDAAVLKDLGCEFGQGYLFAKPLAIADADALIGSWKRPNARNLQFRQVG